MIYLAVEIKLGKIYKEKRVIVSMTKRRRWFSGLLGFSSLSLVIDTLVHATCMDDVSNENVLSKKVWTLFRPLFSATTVGMYGQFFTMFLHIFLEREASTTENMVNVSGEQRHERKCSGNERRGHDRSPNVGTVGIYIATMNFKGKVRERTCCKLAEWFSSGLRISW